VPLVDDVKIADPPVRAVAPAPLVPDCCSDKWTQLEAFYYRLSKDDNERLLQFAASKTPPPNKVTLQKLRIPEPLPRLKSIAAAVTRCKEFMASPEYSSHKRGFNTNFRRHKMLVDAQELASRLEPPYDFAARCDAKELNGSRAAGNNLDLATTAARQLLERPVNESRSSLIKTGLRGKRRRESEERGSIAPEPDASAAVPDQSMCCMVEGLAQCAWIATQIDINVGSGENLTTSDRFEKIVSHAVDKCTKGPVKKTVRFWKKFFTVFGPNELPCVPGTNTKITNKQDIVCACVHKWIMHDPHSHVRRVFQLQPPEQ